MRKWRWSCVAAGATIAVGISTTVPAAAVAGEGDSTPALETLQSLTYEAASNDDTHQEVLSDLAGSDEVETEADGSVSLMTGDDTTTIPVVSSEPIVIDGVHIEIPSPTGPTRGERVDDAVVSFDNGDGSQTVPVLKTDGSVQITTIINSAAAPSVYEYDLTLPDGANMSIDQAGVVTASRDGKFIIGVAPAWAVDATGLAVPTHYDIEGSKLRQIVEHRAGDFAYPIVADPWAGARLFDRVWVSGNQHVSMITSAWGRVIQSTGGGFGWAAGQVILNSAGWSEAVSAVGMLASKATYSQQYQCHVLGAYTPLSGGPSWDLEGWRGNRPWWRTDGGAFPYKCNWP